MEYAELQVTSNFSFLRGASHPDELVAEAAKLGLSAVGLTDVNSLAGIVRALSAAEEHRIPFLTGCRLEVLCEEEFPIATELPSSPSSPPPSLLQRNTYVFSVLAYPTNLAAYGRLARLLSLGKLRAEKGECLLTLDDLLRFQEDLVLIAVPPVFRQALPFQNQVMLNFQNTCQQLLEGMTERRRLFVALTKNYEHDNFRHVRAVADITRYLGIPLVATNDVYYHRPERKMLQDVLTCIRHKTNVQKAGYLLFPNSERSLKPAAEMARLFRDFPSAIRRTLEITEMVSGFSPRQLQYQYPSEICPEGKAPLVYLTELTWQGAEERYPHGVPLEIQRLIREELKLIHELQYEKYFLTCYDIVRFARERGILCQGRGAAANSAVCYCLGITAVDPDRIDLLFARFVSKERNEPPDIDIDFEHERREEVIQYIYQKYGRERAALTAEVVTYRARSAVREVGKALGLSLEMVDTLAKSLHRWTGCKLTPSDLQELGLNPEDPIVWNTLVLCRMLHGFPRHLSQHVGGFVISEQPLCEIVPILNASMEDRTIIEWDKDDIETLGMLKIDILALGILTCVRKAIDLVNQHELRSSEPKLEFHTIPAEDPAVYDMVCAADTVGVFQIESRAQMSMLPRLRPRCFYDLVVEVAIVRPGPIHGNMVHPYLKRRNGLEQVRYPDEEVKAILGKTLGVPLFQEQAMRLAIVLAGFTPGEAEKLRRAMAAWKRNKHVIAEFKDRIVAGMQERGYSREFAENCVEQLKGFSEYGFPESHAASFALLVYASAWLKRHHPAAFTTALLNSLPMGFYAPSQIIADAKAHGVGVNSIDINHSDWDCRIESLDRAGIVRLGMRLVKGLSKSQMLPLRHLVLRKGPFRSIETLWSAASLEGIPLTRSSLVTLARADAFSSMNLRRREALWQIRGLPERVLPLDRAGEGANRIPRLRPLSTQMDMFADYESTGFSLRGHPIGAVREYLRKRMVQTASELNERKRTLRHGRGRGVFASAAGISIIRQRPGTSNGVVFVTIEDETGQVNLIIRPKVFERYERLVLMSSCLLASGFLQTLAENDTSNLVYILVTSLERLDEQVLRSETIHMPVRSYSY